MKDMWEVVYDCMFRVLARKKCRYREIIAGITLSVILYIVTDLIDISHVEMKQRQTRFRQYFSKVSKADDSSKELHFTSENYGTEVIQSCVLPDLPLWTPEVNSFIKKPFLIECNNDTDWVYTDRGKFYITAEATRKHGKIQCAYVPIVNSNDSFKELKPISPMLNGSDLVSDAFKVTCKASNGNRYTNIHACIAPISKHKIRRAKSDNFNIFIFGFDSLSRQMFKRLLPKTHAYFTETLGGKLLEGYNIIGDGTPQALMPLLTGKQETEIPEVRRGKAGARHVDEVLKFFWTRCEKKGYVTQWGEDMAHVGTFNLRMLGFRDQPVHHYMRPFQLAAIPMYPSFRKHCLGYKPRYKVFIDWLKEGLITNKGKNFFTFGFFTELSHNNNNPVSIMDEENVKFLEFINKQGFLDNTVLIMMSDHGLRFGPMRSTEQGKLEERLPYFGFRLPETFKQAYPDRVKAFDKNTKRLATPFDVHETLLNIIGERKHSLGDDTARGLSLFKEIPENRTCAEAGIEPHWCACLKQTSVPESDFNILVTVNAVLTMINDVLEPFRDVCHKVTLDSVTKALKLETNEHVLKFRRSLDADGRVPDMNDKLEAKEVIYQVTFVTKPNNGMFEATVKMQTATGNCSKISPSDISRINKYGDDPKCILDTVPQLRPYCVCRANSTLV